MKASVQECSDATDVNKTVITVNLFKIVYPKACTCPKTNVSLTSNILLS